MDRQNLIRGQQSKATSLLYLHTNRSPGIQKGKRKEEVTYRLEEALVVALVDGAEQRLRVGQLASDRDHVRVVDHLLEKRMQK